MSGGLARLRNGRKKAVLPQGSSLGGVQFLPHPNQAVLPLNVTELGPCSTVQAPALGASCCPLVSASRAPLWVIFSPTAPQTPSTEWLEGPSVSFRAARAAELLPLPAAALRQAAVGGLSFSSK